mmetsp:Transcript_13452/g.32050  ORF Transcript_13452/g.32050 Transcript_13452/m.32050 type:complete len:361 (-) Transcript_13452:405-1487(-)
MLALDVFGLSAEHGERECRLDVVVPEDRGRHARNDLLHNVRVLCHFADLLLVLLGQAERRVDVVFLADVVRLDVGRKDWEAVFAVQRRVKVVLVDASDLDLLAGPRAVDQVALEDHILVPRQPSGRHRPRRLLQRHLLVVVVQSPILVDAERPAALALRAGACLGVVVGLDLDRARCVPALAAVVVDKRQLGVDLGAARDDASDLDHRVQMHLADIAKFVDNRQADDTHEDLLVDVLVVGIQLEHDVHGCFMQRFQDRRRRVRDPDAEDWLRVGEFAEGDLEALLVGVAHLLDLVAVHRAALVVGEGAQEVAEAPLDFFARKVRRDELLERDAFGQIFNVHRHLRRLKSSCLLPLAPPPP